jgi:hypothetical protein
MVCSGIAGAALRLLNNPVKNKLAEINNNIQLVKVIDMPGIICPVCRGNNFQKDKFLQTCCFHSWPYFVSSGAGRPDDFVIAGMAYNA